MNLSLVLASVEANEEAQYLSTVPQSDSLKLEPALSSAHGVQVRVFTLLTGVAAPCLFQSM